MQPTSSTTSSTPPAIAAQNNPHPDRLKVIISLAIALIISIGCLFAAPFIPTGYAIGAVVIGISSAVAAGIYAVTRGKDFLLSRVPPEKKKSEET